MPDTAPRTTSYGGWLLVAASAIGFVLSIYNCVNEGNGIAYSEGAVLVVVSTALVLAASLAMVLDHDKPAWLAGFFYVSIFLGLVGTAIAAYFRIAYWLAGLMIVGLIGWLIHLCFDPSDEELAAHAIRKEVMS
jgi:hypothetical protein